MTRLPTNPALDPDVAYELQRVELVAREATAVARLVERQVLELVGLDGKSGVIGKLIGDVDAAHAKLREQAAAQEEQRRLVTRVLLYALAGGTGGGGIAWTLATLLGGSG